jgi:hypothetical protein
VNVNVLWRGRESLHNNSKHIQYLLWSGLVLFTICWL